MCLAIATISCESAPSLCTDCKPSVAATSTWWFSSPRPIATDILLVVDTTPAAAALCAQLVEELPAALDTLAVEGAMPSVHLGVVETTVRPSSSCPQPGTTISPCRLDPGYTFLATGPCGAYIDNGSRRQPETDAACLANLVPSACAGGDPLETAARVLRDPVAAGLDGAVPFLRRDARLLVVILSSTTEDPDTDATPRPAAEIVRAIQSSRDGATPVSIVVVEPAVAESPPTVATALGARLAEVASAFGASGAVAAASPGIFINQFGWSLRILTEPRCLGAVKDTDATADGVQPNCVVARRRLRDDGTSVTEALPACDVAAAPCWRLVPFDFCTGRVRLEIVDAPGFCPQNVLQTDIVCEA